MKLSAKLPLSFAAAILLALTAALGGIYSLNQALLTYGTVVQVNYANEHAMAEVLSTFKEQVHEWKDVLLRGKKTDKLNKHWSAFLKQERAVADKSAQLQANLPAGESKAILEKFIAAHARMSISYHKAFDEFKAAGFDSAVGDAGVVGMDREPSKLLAQATSKIESDNAAIAASANAGARSAVRLSLLGMLAACGVGMAGSVWLSRRITTPLNQAVKVAETVAAGDLTSHIEVVGTDETGHLLQALKDMQESLARIVGIVRSGTETISTASCQIASGNLALSARTEEEASSLEETASSMEQITSTVRQNSEHARAASKLALEASGVAVKGGSAVSQVVNTMGAINESSKKIVDIIGVIDGIAFQTNILALNAAVEAARAGEQGRGFAVVASEVRSLAQRSASAAKEIKALIGASVEQVDAGSRLVGLAGVTMEEVVASVKRVTDIISDIALASGEQNSGIEQINHAITQMDSVTQQNAAMVEEAAAAADALQGQAEQLATAVQIFKIAAEGGTTAVPARAAMKPARSQPPPRFLARA